MLRTKRSVSRSQKDILSTGAAADRLRKLAIDADLRAEATNEPQRAETLWRAIAHAEWAPVDAFEARGRRFLIAKSPTSSAGCVAIETFDRVILTSRATGTSLKVIASELGVSITTVARRLRSAMRQLGLLNALRLSATTTLRGRAARALARAWGWVGLDEQGSGVRRLPAENSMA